MSEATTDQLIAHMSTRFGTLEDSVERVERGIFGDSAIGHRGVVARLDAIDETHEKTAQVHGTMTDDRVAGDRRTNKRIDEVERYVQRVEKKIDRMLFAFMGAGLVSGGSVAAFLSRLG